MENPSNGITTHVLDLVHGCPAGGVRVQLLSFATDWKLIAKDVTNSDGRSNGPLVRGPLKPTRYELIFYIGEYFRSKGFVHVTPHFLEEVVIRFSIIDTADHYHVPLLVSAFGYSTYRGS